MPAGMARMLETVRAAGGLEVLAERTPFYMILQ